MKKIILIMCVIVIFLAPSVLATDYYVSPTGLDTNDGLSPETAWATLDHAANVLGAGDTLYIREGTYTNDCYSGWDTYPSGAVGNPITIKAYPGETPIFTGQGVGPSCLSFFDFINQDYMIVEGLTFEDTIASEGIIRFRGSSDYGIVRNCTFRLNQLSTGPSAIQTWSSNYMLIENNYFDGVGNPAGEGSGDCIWLRGNYNLVQNNYFSRCGHYAVDIIRFNSDAPISHHNVIRNNTIEQHWGGGLGILMQSYRNLVENNEVYYSGEGVSGQTKSGIQITALDNIVRNNIFAEGGDGNQGDKGISLEAYQPYSQDAINNRIYNNVVYDNEGRGILFLEKDGRTTSDNKAVNNIFYSNENYVAGPYDAELGFILYSYPTNLGGNKFNNNLLLVSYGGVDYPGSDELIEFAYLAGAAGYEIDSTLASAETNYPSSIYSNVEENPGFVDADNHDFTLTQDSPAIDAGDFLTRTTSSGSSTTTVNVDDADYFMDGWGIVEADEIVVGSNAPVTITSVDYDNDVITVDTPISFSSGAGVSLPYSGNAPDIGAFEFEGPVAPPVCGDGSCNGGETCASCPGDCPCADLCCAGVCRSAVCTVNADCGVDDACTTYTCQGVDCDAACSETTITACADSDGCCPNGCTDANDNDCPTIEGYLMLWLPLDGNRQDASGNGNHGSCSGSGCPVFVAGHDGQAADFDGIDDVITVSDNAGLSITGELTLTAWIYPEGDLLGETLISKDYNGEYDLTFWHIGGQPRLYYFDSYSSTGNAHSFDYDFSSNTWYHIAVVRDSSTVKLYIDGVDVNDDYTFTTPPTDTASNVYIGDRPGTGSDEVTHFDGIIDDVRIYSTALSAAEVQDIYTGETGICGDDTCNPGETCSVCPQDCIQGDVNGDCGVGLADLIIVAGNFGCSSNCGDSDVDGNGVVNILDLILVGKNFF